MSVELGLQNECRPYQSSQDRPKKTGCTPGPDKSPCTWISAPTVIRLCYNHMSAVEERLPVARRSIICISGDAHFFICDRRGKFHRPTIAIGQAANLNLIGTHTIKLRRSSNFYLFKIKTTFKIGENLCKLGAIVHVQ